MTSHDGADRALLVERARRCAVPPILSTRLDAGMYDGVLNSTFPVTRTASAKVGGARGSVVSIALWVTRRVL